MVSHPYDQGYRAHICVNTTKEAALSPLTSLRASCGMISVCSQLPPSPWLVCRSGDLEGVFRAPAFTCFSPSFLYLTSDSLGCNVLK